MVVSIERPALTAAMLGVAAQVRENHAPLGGFVACHALEFSDQIRIRQAMKAVTPHALCLELPRHRHDLRHARQVAMKGRVEARDLRQIGELAGERFEQGDFARQMGRIQRAQTPQLGDHFRRNPLGINKTLAAVHDAMSDGADFILAQMLPQPVDQLTDGLGVIAGGNRHLAERLAKCIAGAEHRLLLADPDPFHLAGQYATRRLARREQGELDAGRTAVDRQQASGHGQGIHRRGAYLTHLGPCLPEPKPGSVGLPGNRT